MLEGLPPYLLVARISAVLGMALSLALGLLLLIGGALIAAAIAFAMLIPAFALMFFAERRASPHRSQ